MKLLASPSMPCTTFIITLAALPTTIVLLSFFAMDRVTRHIFRVRLIVTCRPVLLEPFEVLSGVIWCYSMRNELWVDIATASLNRIFLWGSDFFLVNVVLLTLGVDCYAVSLSIISLLLYFATFEINE